MTKEELEKYVGELSPEMQEKARQCKDRKELNALLAENDAELSDDVLEAVAGGLSKEEYRPIFNAEIGNFAAGQTVSGTIYSIEPGLAVYVKISENLIATDATVGCEGNIYRYKNLKVGDTVAVYIERIIPEKMKIKVRIV